MRSIFSGKSCSVLKVFMLLMWSTETLNWKI